MEQLAIPALLEEMIATARWPTSAAKAQSQNLRSLVSKDRLQTIAPEEGDLFLYAPPFQTVATLIARGEVFWDRPSSDPSGLVRDKALAIGDFGLGADAPIVLDYRDNPDNPTVRYLQWIFIAGEQPGTPNFGSQNSWVVLAPSFEAFVERLGL
jgi:hypothetical protein